MWNNPVGFLGNELQVSLSKYLIQVSNIYPQGSNNVLHESEDVCRFLLKEAPVVLMTMYGPVLFHYSRGCPALPKGDKGLSSSTKTSGTSPFNFNGV